MLEQITRNAPTRADLARQITAAWQKQLQSIFETGRLLIRAKEALAHGEFGKMIKGELPFSPATAEMLMAIARHPVLSNPNHGWVLPPAWTTLYRLTHLPDDELESLIADGRIHAELRRRDVEELIQEHRARGLYKFDDIPQALNTLLKFVGRWPDPRAIARFVFDVMGEGDDAVDLDDFAKVLRWLTDLHSACLVEKQKREQADGESGDLIEEVRIRKRPFVISRQSINRDGGRQ